MWTVANILPRVAPTLKGAACLDHAAGRARAIGLYNDICEELLADDA
jgi:hypothetical protein